MSTISQICLPFEFTYQQVRTNIMRHCATMVLSSCTLPIVVFIGIHRTPDWKFHISTKHQHLPQAWNLIAGLFTTMKCRTALKTYYLKQCTQPQPGREITLYILKYQDLYRKSAFANDFDLSRADQHSEEYWYEFVKNIEETLETHGIQTNGLAPGDYKIGKYVSLRNQAFVQGKNSEFIYPPNELGWNPLNQQLPLNLYKLESYLKQEEDEEKGLTKKIKQNKNWLISFGIPLVLFTIIYFSKHKTN